MTQRSTVLARHRSGKRLRRLTPWGYAACVVAMCSPLFWVSIPPLMDAPGHIAAAAIESAPPGSALHRYYAWRWSLNPNVGGEVLMKVLGGDLTAGWWATLLVTGTFLAGALAVVGTLNPRGSYGLGWAMIFALGFPWLWGFLNFLLAAGLAMLTFAATHALASRPARRATLLLLAQPFVFLCHSIGELLLPTLVVGAAIGEAIARARSGDGRARGWRPLVATVVGQCWPVAMTPALVVGWMVAAPAAGDARLSWDWHDKLSFLNEVLRDQDRAVDRASEAASYALLLFGALAGARWRWGPAAVVGAVLLLYVALPTTIGGSQAVDTRLLPVVLLLALGLQDWSGARPRVAASVAIAGAAVLVLRLALMTSGFVHYAADYRGQLAALDRVAPGGRIFVIRERRCGEAAWRLSRLDTLPALASPVRGVWINTQWAVPGLDMLQFRYHAEAPGEPVADAMVWAPGCAGPDRPGLASSLPRVPYGGIDYLWLLDTGPPLTVDPRLTPIWHWRRSYLYAVRR